MQFRQICGVCDGTKKYFTVKNAGIAGRCRIFRTMLPALTVLSILFALAYAGLMLVYGRGWRALPEWVAPTDFVPKMAISVIIPARNEADNIGGGLDAILGGHYPSELLEIIVVDDHSEDATPDIVRDFAVRFPAVRLLQLADFITPNEQQGAFKKKALEVAIARAKGEIMVTTDADCVFGPDWLRLVASVFELAPKPVQLLTAPVVFHHDQNLLQRFQTLDFLGLMGITGAGIHYKFQRMGNGANLAYRKQIFEEMNGFAGNENHASGDDMFLIQKVAAQYPDGIFFLKNKAATVFTEAKSDWPSFLQQRLRWGTKNAALPEWPVRLALASVFLFCWSIIFNVLALPFALPIKIGMSLRSILIFQLALKVTADYLFLGMMCRYFGRRDLLRWFWPSFFLHTVYIAGVGTASLFFKKFEWKGREVK